MKYQISLSSNEVIRVLSAATEKYDLFASIGGLIEKNHKAPFWGTISNNSFRIYQKSRKRGYTNSYAPWIVGQVVSNGNNSVIIIKFATDRNVHSLDSLMKLLASGFAIIILAVSLYDLLAGSFDRDNAINLIFVTLFLLVFFFMRRRGMASVDDDKKKIQLEFENLFEEYGLTMIPEMLST